MKKNLFIFAVLIFLISGACIQTGEHHSSLDSISEDLGPIGSNGEYVDIIHKSFDGASVKVIQADLVSPEIKITGDASGQTTVDVKVSGKGTGSLSKEALMTRLRESYEVNIDQSGDQVSIGIRYKKKNISAKEALSFKFEVHTGSNVRANIQTVSGDMVLNRLGATVANSVSGNIDISSIQGDASVSSVSGGIKLTQASGTVNLKSISGEITAAHIGKIEDAESVSGSIQVDAGALAGDVNLKSTSGSISLKLPSSTNADITLESISGSLDVTGFDNIQNLSKSRRSMSAKINDGGTAIKGSTVSGNIKIEH